MALEIHGVHSGGLPATVGSATVGTDRTGTIWTRSSFTRASSNHPAGQSVPRGYILAVQGITSGALWDKVVTLGANSTTTSTTGRPASPQSDRRPATNTRHARGDLPTSQRLPSYRSGSEIRNSLCANWSRSQPSLCEAGKPSYTAEVATQVVAVIAAKCADAGRQRRPGFPAQRLSFCQVTRGRVVGQLAARSPDAPPRNSAASGARSSAPAG